MTSFPSRLLSAILIILPFFSANLFLLFCWLPFLSVGFLSFLFPFLLASSPPFLISAEHWEQIRLI